MELPNEDPFMLIPEGREDARHAVAERLQALDRERSQMEHLRAHLHGNTQIGETLSFFYGQHAECPNEFAEADLQAAEAALLGFFADPEGFRDAWEAGTLSTRVAEEVAQAAEDLPHPPGDHVAVRVTAAIDAVIAAERSAV